MGKPWRWFRRQRARQPERPVPAATTGTELVVRWIDAVTTAIATARPGPAETIPARICDGMFTAASVTAVLIEKGADRNEYRVAHNRCMAAAVEFMKVLGEDTLRRHRVHAAQPVGWKDEDDELDEPLVVYRLGLLGEALQLALCAVTTDRGLPEDIRESAEESGLLAADVLVEACEAVRTDPTV